MILHPYDSSCGFLKFPIVSPFLPALDNINAFCIHLRCTPSSPYICIIIFAGRTFHLTSNLKFHSSPRKRKVFEQQRLKRRRNPSTVNCKTSHLRAANCNPQGDSVLRLLGTQTGLFFCKYSSCSFKKGRKGKTEVSNPKRTPYIQSM